VPTCPVEVRGREVWVKAEFGHSDAATYWGQRAEVGMAHSLGLTIAKANLRPAWPRLIFFERAAARLAASQPVGLRESFGSMNKSFNPGRAASNGIFAALLASKNFTSSDHMIEAKRGWANTVSTKQDYGEILDGLGSRGLAEHLQAVCARNRDASGDRRGHSIAQ
jgi:hypothetical protein